MIERRDIHDPGADPANPAERNAAFPTGEVAFLMTDIEGSTRLWDQAPDAMRVALQRHDELLDAAIEDAGGYVFCRAGDSFAAAFHNAESAVQAATRSQRALAAEPWPDGIDMRVRMAVHVGQADERDGNYFGPCVNRCSRLLGHSRAGKVALSGTARARVGAHLAAILDLTDVGVRGLQDLEEPEHVWYCEIAPAHTVSTRNGQTRDRSGSRLAWAL